MAEKKKRDNRTSATGTAVYPRVTGEPDTKFDKDGAFSIKVRYDANDEKGTAFAEALKKEIDERSKKTLADAKKEHPAKVAAAKAKKSKPPEAPKLADVSYFVDDDGGTTFNFKMKASGVTKDNKPWSRKPALFDAKGTPITGDIKLGGGSLVKVNFEPSNFYTSKVGAGVSLRLNAVQVIKLVEWTGGTAASYGFTEEEGFSTDEVSAEAAEAGFENEESADDDAPVTGKESDEF